jgi:TetR/AcrR family transcriptional repressor of nem operon
MANRGEGTRAQIMDVAQQLILSQGFAATSVDAVIARTGLTKGAFFHHFRSKNELAQALMERFAEQDAAFLDRIVERAERLARDPLQQVLLVVGLLEETLTDEAEEFPGCLYASYAYEAGLFDERTHGVIREALLRWRARLADLLRRAALQRPPRVPLDPGEAADMLNVVVEGAYVMSRALGDPALVARQLRHYRSYLELAFGVAGDSGDGGAAILARSESATV